jgi:hypothetical protein
VYMTFETSGRNSIFRLRAQARAATDGETQ